MPTAQTPSIFDPVSSPALAIRELSFVVLGLSAVIFVVVAGVAAYTLVRFRNRPGDGRREPPQVYGSTQIELAWTVVPFLIVMVLFLVTARYIYGIEGRAMPSDALEVTVVGNQWWWEIRYPQLGIVTANELHVPVSDAARPTRTFITLESADVITASGSLSSRARPTSSPARPTGPGSSRGRRAPTLASVPSSAGCSTRGCFSGSPCIRGTSSIDGLRRSEPQRLTFPRAGRGVTCSRPSRASAATR